MKIFHEDDSVFIPESAVVEASFTEARLVAHQTDDPIAVKVPNGYVQGIFFSAAMAAGRIKKSWLRGI